MKVTKHYENDHVVLYVEEGDFNTCITLDSEQMMRRLGECLVDLHRTGGRQVEIGGGDTACNGKKKKGGKYLEIEKGA